MEDIMCATCLSTDRKVFSAKSLDTTRFGFQLINDATVCWECKKVIENIQTFRDKVTQAQIFLNSSTRNKTRVSLSTLSSSFKDTYDKVYLHNDSVETEPFIEIKVKGEPPECVQDNLEPVKRESATNELESSLKCIPIGLLKTVLKEEAKSDSLRLSESKRFRLSNTQTQLSSNSASVSQRAELTSFPVRIICGNERPTGNSGTQNYCMDKFECGDCGKQFRSKPILQQHIEVEHVNKLLYTCRQCPEKYTSELSMFVHERKAHHTKKKAKKQPIVCLRCGKYFTSREGLKQHQNTHTGARPYACDVCGDAFGYRSVLYVHRRLKHLGLKRSSKLKTGKT